MFCPARRKRAALPVCLLGLLFGLQVASCEPTQQQQQQRRSGSSELSQDSFAMAAPEALAALSSYGRATGGYVNSKRARKMSAFMPMRGRKDGRDALPSRHQLQQAQLDGFRLEQLGRELEPSSELSVLRLMARPLLLSELEDRPTQSPRQFVEQLEAMARQRATGSGQLESAGAFSAGAGASPVGAVETKYRRAFHPMRGKKADAQMGSGSAGEDESDSEASFVLAVGEPYDS